MGLCDKPNNYRIFTDLNKQKYDNNSHPQCNGSFWILRSWPNNILPEHLFWHITSTHVQHDFSSILNADKLCGMLGKPSLITRNLIVKVEDFKLHGPRMKIMASSYVTANHCVKHINIWVTMLKLEDLRFLISKQMDNGKHHKKWPKLIKGLCYIYMNWGSHDSENSFYFLLGYDAM